MILDIVTLPNNKLREPSRALKPAEIKKLELLITNMTETMHIKDGIGLAAPQIGQNIRLCTIGHSATPDKKDWALINPQIIKHSWRKTTEEEGCLSVPGVTVAVKRSAKITVKALNAKGQPKTFTASGYLARVLQHEIDHLDGILIIDKKE
jgi:peptide deformylase